MTNPLRAVAAFAALTAAGLSACSADGGTITGPEEHGSHVTPACAHDNVAPTIASVAASPNVLWPPNHKMVPVTVTVAASDACSAVTSSIADVASDEPVNGLGDGNTSPDWVVTGPLTLLVRSERSGLGDGRVYTITVRAVDAAGNAATGRTTVTVPHDQRGK